MKHLILVPTELERGLVAASLGDVLQPSMTELQLCGFGPIAAAARGAQLIARYRPEQVTLIGIAGSLREGAVVGRAYEFAAVDCEGIGVGSGEQFQSAAELGWPQIDRDADSSLRLGDRIETLNVSSPRTALQLLTVCAGSAHEADADRRRRRFHHAHAEDMEGFGVAISCALASVPLRIIRGISNRAGDRNHSGWRTAEALEQAVRLLRTAIADD